MRMNVCPPDVCEPAETLWSATLRWLVGGDMEAVPALRTPLEKARSEFVAALAGLLDADHDGLLKRAQHARSLRELWHLRAEVYRLVGTWHSQHQAQERVSLLNRHFPTRAPRSQFAML